MKTRLHVVLYGLLICGLLFFSQGVQAQIDYSENFDGEHEWELLDFYEDEGDFGVPCTGADALYANLYDGWFLGYEAEMTSPSIGTSDGGVVTLTYQYKILEYDSEPTEPTQNEDDWGFFTVAYATSPEGPFTVIETINPQNHIESVDCATRTVIFTPPTGEEVYIRIYAELDDLSNDFLLFIDEIDVIETEAVDCDGAPSAATALASVTEACINEDITLSFTPVYTIFGLSYQWQSSTNGTDFVDVATGGDGTTYTTMQPETTWYRVMVTCDATGDATPSTAVQVTSNGQLCYCEMEFNNVEPITLVQFAGIDNETSAELDGTPALEDFTSLSPGEVTLGETYEITLMGNTGGEYESYMAVYIDFNHDGDMNDEGEIFEIGFLFDSDGEDGVDLTGDITIPEDAMEGLTRMRVVKHWYDEFGEYPGYLEDPCGGDNSGYGQTEDYLINISAPAEPPVFDYYNLQWPGTMTYPNVDENYTIYAQAYEPGVTEAAGLGEGVMGWIGFSTENTDPATWDESNWIEGTFNQTDNNNDEVTVTVDGSLPAGTYYYASRWQLADGPYTYGGFQGAWNGTDAVNGVLTVLCTTPAPTVEMMTQEFCANATVADLQATATEEGGTIVWYATMDAETALAADTLLADGTTYFAAQMANDCEGDRVPVIAVVNMTTPPTVDSPQVIEVETGSEATVEDLMYTGEGTITWYTSLDDVVNSENGLEAGAVITSGTYYATLTVDGCESDYMTVEVEVLLGTNGFTKGTFTYYPNPVKDMLNLSYSEGITGVEVFNLVGQRVMSMTIGQNDVAVDMAALASGTYVVKVSSGDAAAMIKVVKE